MALYEWAKKETPPTCRLFQICDTGGISRTLVIKCFHSDLGQDEIAEWYKSQKPKVRTNFKVRFEYLRDQDRKGWERPYYSPLTRDRECKGLGEIRFTADGNSYRPLGFMGPGKTGEFTILMCAIEKDYKLEPRNACKIAQRLKSQVERDNSRAKKCSF